MKSKLPPASRPVAAQRPRPRPIMLGTLGTLV